jgi:hypothetical protein
MIHAMNKREAKIIIRMLKTETMPSAVDEQLIAQEGLDWLKMRKWVIETTGLSGDRTFQQTPDGQKIAEMDERQLLKDMVDEHAGLSKVWAFTNHQVAGGVIVLLLAAAAAAIWAYLKGYLRP